MKNPAEKLMQTLKTLDPAQEITMTETRRAQATQTLQRALSTPGHPPTDTVASPTPHRPARRRPGFRLAVALPVAAALAGAVVAVQATSGNAYESWTPVAAAVSDEDLSVAVNACYKEFAAQAPITMGLDSPKTAAVRVAERRGDFVMVILQRTDIDGMYGDCRVEMPEGSTTATVDGSTAGAGGLDPDGPRGVATYMGSAGGHGFLGLGGDPVSSVIGSVGSDVRGLTVHSGDTTVRASVKDGTFVAWWPGKLTQPISYDITLDDGRVIKDVPHTGLYAND